MLAGEPGQKLTSDWTTTPNPQLWIRSESGSPCRHPVSGTSAITRRRRGLIGETGLCKGLASRAGLLYPNPQGDLCSEKWCGYWGLCRGSCDRGTGSLELFGRSFGANLVPAMSGQNGPVLLEC